MNEFESYIKHILKSLECGRKEKEELREEFLDHLNMLKEEHQQAGHTEEEAIRNALKDFGQTETISHELNKSISLIKENIYKVLKISFWFYIFNVIRILWIGRIGYGIRFGQSINLKPFTTIIDYFVRFERMNFIYFFNNIIGNIIFFMPFGFLLPIVYGKGKTIKDSFFYILIFSFTIEAVQHFFNLGVFDIDDIILNVIGGVLGCLVYKLCIRILKIWHKEYLL